MKKNVLAKVMMLVALFASVALTSPVHAWIGTGGASGTPGSGSGGADCTVPGANKYRLDCAGVSWIFYKSINANPADAKQIKFPVYANASRAVNYDSAIIPAECAQHTASGGGFWHFGFNAFPGSDWYFTNFYHGQPINMGASTLYAKGNSSSAARAGHWETTTWGTWVSTLSHWNSTLLKTNTSADQIIENLYQADSSKPGTISNNGDSGLVYDEFVKTWKIDYPGTTPPSSIPTDVYGFCYYGDMEYLSKSNVSATDTTSSVNKYTTTDITVSGDAETEINVGLDSPVRIIFSHNPYSSMSGDVDEEDPAKWDVYRIYYKEDGEDTGGYTPFNNTRPEWFEIEVAGPEAGGTFDENGISEAWKYGDIEYWTEDASGYYIGNEREYTDTATDFAARDAMVVTFKQSGTWKFCEENRVYKDEDSIDAGAKTRVCVKIVVGDAKDYYSVSNSSNDHAPGYVTTGIVNTQARVVSTASSVPINEAVEMTFSHNIYSDRKIEDELVSWNVDTDWTSSADWSISDVLVVPRSGSHKMPLEEFEYYTVENNNPRYNDGYNNYYIVREKYSVIFNQAGTYEFCETVFIEGEQYTTSCVEITVEDIPPTVCSQWRPDTYIKSGTLQGSMVEGTTSLVSKIRNDSLTGRNAGGAYSNWLGTMVPNSGTLTGPMATTYAKPGDLVNWANCYWPGAQKMYTEQVVAGNAHLPDSGPSNTHSQNALSSEINFQNDYRVTSSTDSINGVFRVGNSIIGMPNTINPPDVAPILSPNGSNPFTLDAFLAPGDYTARESNNDYDVRYRDDAGKTYKEIMTSTGKPYYVKVDFEYHWWWWCPFYCYKQDHTNRFRGSYNKTTYSYNNGDLKSQTQVIVPYNFINSAKFDVSTGRLDGDDVVFAGDTIKIENAEVTVGERNNAVTAASYITQVDEAEVRLIAYVSERSADEQIARIGVGETGVAGEQTPVDYGAASTNLCDRSWIDKKQCMEVNKYMYDGVNTTQSPATTTLYNRENSTDPVTYGDTTGSYKPLGFSGSYNVYDASAGDYMCFAIAVFPWRSGPEGSDAADKTTNPAGTESKWLITAPKCIQIAKKPAMEVLGSSLYTNGSIVSSVSRKYNLFDSTSYRSVVGAVANPAIYFGSFDELGVVANGTVNKFASGAAVGRTTSNAAGYGATNNEYCKKWVPLSFANYTNSARYSICGNNFEASGQADITDASIVDREALVDYFIPVTATAEIGNRNIGDLGSDPGVVVPNGAGKDIRYYYYDNDIRISRGALAKLQTRVVKAEGDVYIFGDVEYTGSYESSAEVPKAVIYAAGDIHISCNVGRVDALLIAGGTVYSCYDEATGTDYTVADTGTMQQKNRSLKQLVINGVVLSSHVEFARTYGTAAGRESGRAAEIVNYDTSALVWGRSAAGANDSNAMSTVYMHELAPRY